MIVCLPSIVPDTLKYISEDERQFVTLDKHKETVIVHLTIHRELWNLITELIYMQTRASVYREAYFYLSKKLIAASKEFGDPNYPWDDITVLGIDVL